MSFTHGKNAKIYMNGYNLSSYMDSIDGAGTNDVAEVSTFGTVQKPYIAGLEDGTISMEGFYDSDTTAVETAIFSAMGNSALLTWYPGGDTLGYAGYGMDADATAHSIRATLDGATRVTIAAQSSTGLEHLISLHPLGTVYSAAFTGTAVNSGAGSTSGGSAYLQVTTSASTAVVSIRHSTDNFSADDTELVAFTAASARTYERKTFTGTVKQYVRVYVNITASETITFNVGFNRE